MKPRSGLLLLLALLVLAAFAAVSGAAPVARSASTCKPPDYPGSGYFTKLRTRHVTCARGRKVTLAHYRCRTRHGKKGRCGAVLGYRCTEHRNAIPTEFDSTVTCVDGAKRVIYSYQQFL